MFDIVSLTVDGGVFSITQTQHNLLSKNIIHGQRTQCIPTRISSSSTKDVWTRAPSQASSSSSSTSFSQQLSRIYCQNQTQRNNFLDHYIDMEDLLKSIAQTASEEELFALLSPYKGRQLSVRFMVSLLSRESDWQRSIALLDWINEIALYTPSVFVYNVVIRNVLRAK